MTEENGGGAAVVTLTPERAEEQSQALRDLGYGDEATVDVDGSIRGVEDQGAARRTLEEMADETYVPPILAGTQETLDLKVGGRAPTGSTLRIKGGEYPVRGQYRMNDRVQLVIEVDIEDVWFKTLRDPKTKAIIGRDRCHMGVIAVDGISNIEEHLEPTAPE